MIYRSPLKTTQTKKQIQYSNQQAFYGLPNTVKYCKKCVISNQRPASSIEYLNNIKTKKKTINFINDICDPCEISELKEKKIDWDEREKELKELCDQHRSKKSHYDCIVPGSGGKDSFFVSHVLKHKYKMNPLTVTWAPILPTLWGQNNMLSWTNSGLDNFYVRPNRRVQKLLTRLALENIFHPFQPFMLGQKILAPKLAKKFGIPLIFYGENQAEYGNDKSDLNSIEMKKNYYSVDQIDFDKLYISGLKVSELKDKFLLSDSDLKHYLPMTSEEVVSSKISVVHMSHFLKWHNQSNYYYAKKNSEYENAPERLEGSYSKYISIDDKMEYFNFYCWGIKYGIGWTTATSAYEIRDGDLTREEGIDLIKKFDIEYPNRYIKEFLDFVSLKPRRYEKKVLNYFEEPIIDQAYFDLLTDKFRSPHIWTIKDEKWELRNPIWKEKNNYKNSKAIKNWKGNKIQ